MVAPTISNVARPSASGYGCRINDRLFRLAAGPGRELRVQSAPPQAQRIQTSEVPEEFTDEYGQTFARSDFTGGEGLLYAHDRDNPPDASSRYWDSYNVDTSEPADGSDRVIKLLHTTGLIDAITGTVRLAYNGSALWATDGNTLSKSADPTAAVPTFSPDDPHDGEAATAVLDVATLGSDVYAALGANGIHVDDGSGWAHYNDLQATRLWGVKNRIVATDGDSVYEVIASGAAPTALKTIDPNSEFTAVVDGGAAILAGATDGYVYAFTPTGTAGALVLAAQDLFQGEQIVSLAYAQGLIIVGTREPVAAGGAIGRAWRCDLSGAFTLTNRQLLRQWGDTTTTVDRAPYAMYGARDAVYTAVPDPTATELHTWRYDLANGGISRWFIVADNGTSRSILIADGRMFIGVDDSGVWRQTDTYAASGWLIGPLGDFYSASDKTWVAARLDADVEVGEQVTLQYALTTRAILDNASTDWRNVIIDAGDNLDPETVMANATSRFIAGQVILQASAGNTTPEVRAFGFRAYPADYDVICQLPINVSDRIERHNRLGRRARGRGRREYLALLEFEGVSSTLEVYEMGLLARGQIVQIDAPVAVLSERGTVTQFAMAMFRGKRVAAGTNVAATDGVIGGDMVGALTVGGD